ncbi:hypothetical protein DUI87_29580 [Hirundo rustica rustica]|uniref:ribonuclease H n=1 Tax=Hirundo rustica rustica TaxID=333673 RepID=A0A3M0J545_HIRRU|nr:hypothetical protein DUI87_29580 [Hirundo rustica rustica]
MSVRERFVHRDRMQEHHHRMRWKTLEEGIQQLREVAVLEVLFGRGGQHDNDPDKVRCTGQMLWNLATLGPSQYATYIATIHPDNNRETVGSVANKLRNYESIISGPMQAQVSAVAKELRERMEEVTEEMREMREEMRRNSSHVAPVRVTGPRVRAQQPPARGRGYTPRADLWYFLRDHGEDMGRWDGKPTSALAAQGRELKERNTNRGGSTKMKVASTSHDQAASQGEARENRVYWTVWIRWPGTSEPQKYEALVDTSSQCTLIPSEYVGTEPISIAGVTGGSQELTLLEAEVSLTEKEWQKHPIVTGSGAPCILGIDFLRNGYYKDSKGLRPQFAFTWRGVQYTWNRLPQGWKHSPTICHGLIQAALEKGEAPEHLQYIDDIVWENTAMEVFEKGEKIIHVLLKAGFAIKQSQVKGPAREIQFLGVKWQDRRWQIPTEVINKITAMSPPTSKKETQAFLNAIGFWRMHIPEYSQIVSPLYLVTRKKNDFHWGPEQQQAFAQIKQEIAHAVVLSPVRTGPDVKNVLYSAARNNSLSWSLWQKVPGETRGRPLGFWSRSYRGSEANYTPTEKEILAAYEGVQAASEVIGTEAQLLLAPRLPVLGWMFKGKVPSTHHATNATWSKWIALITQRARIGNPNRPGILEIITNWPEGENFSLTDEEEQEQVTRAEESPPYNQLPAEETRYTLFTDAGQRVKPLWYGRRWSKYKYGEAWQIDYITLPQTRQGKRYVLTMVEATTGWLETYPVPHATARNTILGLEKQILWRHGTPERIESDNGTHFKNSLINTWAREHGIEWVYHIPYHAPAAGKVERCNGLLKTTLKALRGGTFKNWENNLAKVTWRELMAVDVKFACLTT